MQKHIQIRSPNFFQVSHSIYSLSTAVILGTCAAGSCDPLFFEMTVLTIMIMFMMMVVRMKRKMRMRMITTLTRFFGLTIMSHSLLSWMCVIDSVLPRLAQVSCKYVSGGTSLSCQRGHTRRLPDDDEQPYWDGLLPPLLYPFHEPGSNVYLSKLIHVFVKVLSVTCNINLSAFLHPPHEPGHLHLDELHFNRLHQLGHSSHGLCEGTLQQN